MILETLRDGKAHEYEDMCRILQADSRRPDRRGFLPAGLPGAGRMQGHQGLRAESIRRRGRDHGGQQRYLFL